MRMKRNFPKFAALSLFAVFFVSGAAGQSSDLTLRPGVAAQAGLDEVYRRFSEAYRTLNVDLIADQYSQTAAYLVPGDDLVTGRENIRPGFKQFFESVKNNGQTMTISFEIAQRMVEKNLGYDVGIFNLTIFKEGKQISNMKGKFVVVAVKDRDGKWRFQVDGYNDLKRPPRPGGAVQ